MSFNAEALTFLRARFENNEAANTDPFVKQADNEVAETFARAIFTDEAVNAALEQLATTKCPALSE